MTVQTTTLRELVVGGSNPPEPNLRAVRCIKNSNYLTSEKANKTWRSIVQTQKLSKKQLEELRKAISEEIRERFPNKWTDYGIPPEERTPSDKEVEMILNCVYTPQYRIYFETLAMTGARPCELVNLKLEDIDFKNSCIYVWVAKKKNKVKLPKYFPEILQSKLEIWVNSRIKDIQYTGGYVFFNRMGTGSINVLEASKSFRRALLS